MRCRGSGKSALAPSAYAGASLYVVGHVAWLAFGAALLCGAVALL